MSFWLCNLLEFFFCWSQISFSKIGSKLLKLVKQISNIKLCSKFCWLAGLRVPHLDSDDFVTNFRGIYTRYVQNHAIFTAHLI